MNSQTKTILGPGMEIRMDEGRGESREREMSKRGKCDMRFLSRRYIFSVPTYGRFANRFLFFDGIICDWSQLFVFMWGCSDDVSEMTRPTNSVFGKVLKLNGRTLA